jgi:glycosyltransferase involved in cell wall biosynthesis
MTSPAPRVSVLIPCWNAGRYIAETVASAVAQTLPPFEIVLVDDGSTDESVARAREAAPAIVVDRNPGRGAGAARNHASRLARGDFFQYLDADDLLEPHALATRAAALEGTGADVAISDWQRLHPAGPGWTNGKLEVGAPPNATAPFDVQIMRGFWAPPAAILYRRAICTRIGGWSESLPVIQDARFLLDAARVGATFAHVAGVGARYRQHREGSLSTATGSMRLWRDVLQNAREVESLWAADGALDAAHRAALAEVYANCARVGFVDAPDLFAASRTELVRFPEYPQPKFLRAALGLSGLAGYGAARRLMAPFCRSRGNVTS